MKRTDIATNETGITETRSTPDEAIGWRLGRRDWLRLGGAAIASATALPGFSGAAAAAGYSRVIVETDEVKRIRLGDGETLENVLFDISADGAALNVFAEGSDWEIRNVGVSGECTRKEKESIFRLEVAAGETGLFENVYLGDGAVDGGSYTGVFVPTSHAGTLTIRRCNVQRFPDNGVYASAPGREPRGGKGGVVQVEQSYAHNNNTDGFRVGTDGSYVKDSVVHVDGDVPSPSPEQENARGIWVREAGKAEIVNCDVLLEHPDASYCVRQSDDHGDTGGLARVIDSEAVARNGALGRFYGNVETEHVGTDPGVTPPSGVPTSAKEAASGSGDGSDDGGSSETKELTFDGLETDTPFSYAVTVTGHIEKAEAGGSDGADDVSGNTASGGVGSRQDVYEYTGAISGLELDFENGLAVSADRSASRITVSGPSDGTETTYTIAVSGDLKAIDPNPDDAVDGGRAAAVVSISSDSYRYSGDVEVIDIDGITMVRVTPA